MPFFEQIQAVMSSAAFKTRYQALFNSLPKKGLFDTRKRWQSLSRWPENRCEYDERFPTYNAFTLNLAHKHYAIGEGPNPDDAQSVPRLVSATLSASPAFNMIIAIGEHDKSHTYTQYLTQDMNIGQDVFLQKLLKIPVELCVDEFELEDKLLIPFCDFQFYNLNVTVMDDDGFGQRTVEGLAVNITRWPDHEGAQLTNEDILMLLLIAEYQPNLFTHCIAGLGRAPTLTAALIAYQQKLYEMPIVRDNGEALLSKYMSIIREIREHKPNAFYKPEQCLMGLQIAYRMADCYLTYQKTFEAILERHAMATWPEFEAKLDQQQSTQTQPNKAVVTTRSSKATSSRRAKFTRSGDSTDSELRTLHLLATRTNPLACSAESLSRSSDDITKGPESDTSSQLIY